MGYAICGHRDGSGVLAVEGDSAFGFSGMEVETICRYRPPVCVVIFNNDGIYRGTDVNCGGGSDPAPTVFVSSRYGEFGALGAATTPRAQARRRPGNGLGAPTLINAVIDPASGGESGRIGNLTPQSALKKK